MSKSNTGPEIEAGDQFVIVKGKKIYMPTHPSEEEPELYDMKYDGMIFEALAVSQSFVAAKCIFATYTSQMHCLGRPFSLNIDGMEVWTVPRDYVQKLIGVQNGFVDDAVSSQQEGFFGQDVGLIKSGQQS